MTWLDHTFAVLLVAVLPFWAWRSWPDTADAIGADDGSARLHEYRVVMAVQWGVTLTLLTWWVAAGRALEGLGLVWPEGWRLLVSLAVPGIAAIGFLAQARAIMRSDAARAQLTAQLDALGPLQILLPRTARELRGYTALSVTAGWCEELLYRGFLYRYLTEWTGPAVAAGAAIGAFGLAHVYQGRTGAIRAGLAGAVFLGVFVLTGSLLAPILLHAIADAGSGLAAWAARRTERVDNPSDGAAPSR